MNDWIEWKNEAHNAVPVKPGTRVKIRTLMDQYITDTPEKEDWHSDEDIDRIREYKVVAGVGDVLDEMLDLLGTANDEIHAAMTMMMKKGHSIAALDNASRRVRDVISDLSSFRKK